MLPSAEFLESVAPIVGGWHLAAGAANVAAATWAWRSKRRVRAGLWLTVAAGFGVLGVLALALRPVGLPEAVKEAIDSALGPMTLTLGSLAALVVFFSCRRVLVIPAVAWAALDASLAFLGLSLVDPQFAAIVGRPDNVPIVGMVYLLGFFTWLGTYQAVENDRRLSRGLGPVESDYREAVLVWPDVVYLELLGIVIGTAILIVWSLALRAPLEQPANPMLTPNPSKAPWYFLGLQEMLVYFAPWMAGVVLPLLIILGLMAIPYLDVNPKGNGYYTICQRRFAWLVFQFGFLQLWVLLILIGTFMRGPNWSFFGIYEPHDPHKVMAMTNISLSEYCWEVRLGRPLAPPEAGAGTLAELGRILGREAFGLLGLALYYLGIPNLLRWTVLRRFRSAMGFGRFWIMIFLLLTMLLLPLKMFLNWTLHLSYIVSMPEYFFYF